RAVTPPAHGARAAGAGRPSTRTARPARPATGRPTSRPAAARPRGFDRHRGTTAPARRAATPVPGRRIGVMRVVILLCFLALGLRLFAVQVMGGGRYSAIGTAEVTSTVQVPAARGALYDRNGAV